MKRQQVNQMGIFKFSLFKDEMSSLCFPCGGLIKKRTFCTKKRRNPFDLSNFDLLTPRIIGVSHFYQLLLFNAGIVLFKVFTGQFFSV